ncbi:MAG TPA: addiction module protein [Humisphaera sp.]
MTQNVRNILEVVRALSTAERAELADELALDLSHGDRAAGEARDAAWADVADRRDREIDEGAQAALDGEEILAKLERGECP